MESVATSLSAWFTAVARDLPWRRADTTPWAVLVSEFMLQQTPVSRVIPAWMSWMQRWPEPASLALASEGDAIVQWQRLGYPRRALRLHQSARRLVEVHDGHVPTEMESLLALPGVGPYTARAVAVFAFGQRHPVVDINTRRVLARLVRGQEQPGNPSPEDLVVMESMLPQDAAQSVTVNAAMMELGALVCTARRPLCEQCPVFEMCAWRRSGSPQTGDVRGRQPRYEGSDRQARGAVLALARDQYPGCVTWQDLAQAWPNDDQRARAVDTLVSDGLVSRHDDGVCLP